MAVIEGAMGYYDGIGLTDEASAFKIAEATATPAVLALDAGGQALSAAAVLAGFADFRSRSNIRGVIFNRLKPSLYEGLKRAVERETGLKAFGYLPQLKDCAIESRHLGLVTADEIAGLKDKLVRLAAEAEKTVDIEGLLRLASEAPPLEAAPAAEPDAVEGGPLIAVGRDRAFCFYYRDTLRLLERLGAKLAFFSPLEDAALPEGASGLYLGGGYPELYAARLSENRGMLASVRAAVSGGMPTIAECGGFMYLHAEMEAEDGALYPMAGVFPGRTFKTGRLVRFGYVTLWAGGESLLFDPGGGIESLPAHEFHYWDSEDPGESLRAVRPRSEGSRSCAHTGKTLYAGYPHIYLPGNPKAAQRFVKACADYARREAER
jgi:cobyrinic acid a,c-diamide synthase